MRLLFSKWASYEDGEKIEFYSQMSSDHHGDITEARKIGKEYEVKAATLLTHISMMIAVTGIMWTFAAERRAVEIVFGLELLAYLFLALCCIRCLTDLRVADVMLRVKRKHERERRAGGKLDEVEEYVADETYKKIHIVSFVRGALYWLTAALAVSIFWVVLYPTPANSMQQTEIVVPKVRIYNIPTSNIPIMRPAW